MIRTFLCEGDKAGEAVIVEGLDTSIYQDEETGRHLRMATVGMKTYCHACKKVGTICPTGPRLPCIAENGKEAALSGNINMCDCKPPRVFSAQRSMTMFMMSEAIPATDASFSTAVSAASRSKEEPTRGNDGKSFLLRDSETGTRLANRKYISDVDGIRSEGITDSEGYAYVDTHAGQSIRIHVVFASPRGHLTAEGV
ncbi:MULTISPECIES: PAAR domain-containing protein [Paraburkholderia]|uniref:PAAR domain-containing protein n=2 Tax=Paraburkholderia TaxID=1822464 RepID=A0ABW9DL85_9BURK